MALAAVAGISLVAVVLALGDWIPGLGSASVPRTADAEPTTVPEESLVVDEASVAASSDTVSVLDTAPPATEAVSPPGAFEEPIVSAEGTPVDDDDLSGSSAIDPPESMAAEVLALENRELTAELDALREETVELQREMLELDLQVAVLESSERAGEPGSAGEGMAPIELGNTTLVPPPLSASVVANASAGAPVTGALPGDTFGEEPRFDDPSSLDQYLPQASVSDMPLSELRFDDLPMDEPPMDSLEMGGVAGEGMPIERVAIAVVPPGSVAENAGFLPGDVLISIDGLRVVGFDDVYIHDNDDPAPLHDVEVLRGGERVRVTLAASPLELPLQVTWVDPALLPE